jgi:hypothetical protein
VVTIVTPDGTTRRLPRMAKFDVANEILNHVVSLLSS